jgi:flagella basal body P-ring formation protein FlgA
VDGTEIELGEVARIDGAAALVAQLATLEIGYTPSPGYSRVLRMDQVRSAMARRAPQVRVRFQGQRATRVWPKTETISKDALLAAARTALERHVGENLSTLTPIGNIASVSVPSSPSGAILRARVEGTSTSTTSVAIEITVEAGIYRTIWTRWQAERWVDVPVLARTIAVGEVFRPEHFRLDRRSIAGEMPNALSPEALMGTVAVHSMEAGSSVGQSDYRRPLAVQSGANLMLSVKKGAIEARVPVVALGSGSIGGRIRVRIVSSEQEMTAKLISSDLAVIDLGR